MLVTKVRWLFLMFHLNTFTATQTNAQMSRRDVRSVDVIVQGPQNTTVVEMDPVLFTCCGNADQYFWIVSKPITCTNNPLQNKTCPHLSGSNITWTAALEDDQTVVQCGAVCDNMPCGRSENATSTVVEGSPTPSHTMEPTSVIVVTTSELPNSTSSIMSSALSPTISPTATVTQNAGRPHEKSVEQWVLYALAMAVIIVGQAMH